MRLDVRAARRDDGPLAAIDLAIRVRDREFQPQENADLRVTIRQPDGKSVTVDPEPSSEESGLFTTSFVSRQQGGYRADVTLKDARGEPPQTATVGWTSNPAADEFRHIGIDRARMQRLAEETGGEIVALEDLEAFAEGLPRRRAPISETWTSPLWHRSWAFLLVLACLIAEWGLRRTRGLP
jgi:hypothetical protein